MAGTIIPVTMPKFGLAMTEGKIAGWLAHPGDDISAGAELAEIETTKITNVYESPASGILRRQVASEGETLPVGALIGVLAEGEVTDDEIDSFVTTFQSEMATTGNDDKADGAVMPEIVTVGSRRIRVQDAGKGADGAPLLLIHGFGGDLTNWMMTQGGLAGQVRVISFDLPGHGESTKDVGDGSPATLAAITNDLLDTLGLARVHVAGHSLGGAVALELAKIAPSRVASLTLVAPAGLGDTINEAFIDGFINADRRKTLEPVLQMLVHDKALISRQMVDGIIRFKRLDGAMAALNAIARASFENGRQKENLRGVLERFDGRVSVIWGAEDEILPVSGAEGLPAKVAVHVLPDTGHMPQLERSAEVNDLLTATISA
ncbi:acetoin dehydrogenase dihydrolipoyllysine-residue acetyltransferase subunit [Acidomonas methanolica]|uniref:Branched-chain alpha-keto acid dehydrogenase subunit E2 n=1 Tax=Acidomonas methanolica NBRC 104435 TaxID=1231351 RepID=A0A023D6V9_ACIMT|nr:acetoin dehydrogenase dihydrolipoyllysine-residue acetyltransferase subunit [Acidomonas methanolica]MBU2655213.1 acetoin dehydrogenase dihydrolipoyllysine-residue acetyltransferase subunit [Acidomonas methanolica]TCS25617.1 pyruvate dehydrogenase E2 component (dihydrolipoamide acetyltransferase) [Acidomonas methanolica]GAJ29541.1 branched-chain alpha-keto acid dehydrogenase subunit E2 [Acidomonas methanolica NBRC 104435]GBQ51386.1 branched-chain alpha-keto acid dehydrogenase subunit E2 [Acid